VACVDRHRCASVAAMRWASRVSKKPRAVQSQALADSTGSVQVHPH
jgi:hypothetical protein